MPFQENISYLLQIALAGYCNTIHRMSGYQRDRSTLHDDLSVNRGARKLMREPKSCLGRVFNSKLVCFRY
jgi:hypothetical protein